MSQSLLMQWSVAVAVAVAVALAVCGCLWLVQQDGWLVLVSKTKITVLFFHEKGTIWVVQNYFLPQLLTSLLPRTTQNEGKS